MRALSLTNSHICTCRGTMYKLNATQSRQTIHEMTCIKLFLCGSMLKTLILITSEKVKRLAMLIHRVELLCESEGGPTSASHLKSSRSYLNIALTSRNHLLLHHHFHHKIARQDARSLSIYALSFWTLVGRRLPWNLSCPWGANSLPTRKSKSCPTHHLLSGLLLARGRHLGALQ